MFPFQGKVPLGLGPVRAAKGKGAAGKKAEREAEEEEGCRAAAGWEWVLASEAERQRTATSIAEAEVGFQPGHPSAVRHPTQSRTKGHCELLHQRAGFVDLLHSKPLRKIMRTASRLLTTVMVLALLATAANANEDVHAHANEPGRVDFPTSCSDLAQAQFDRALALLHHMTYPQAREGFERAAQIDARCAMAHWGIAMTLFQPLWPTRPSVEALQRGWNEVQTAKTLPLSEHERMFVEAAEAFFVEPHAPDYWARIRRWEQAAEKAYVSMPADPEAAVFYALAHLATTPANVSTREHADRAAGILIRVYERNPDHPGAMHYLVHANDVPGRERELLEVTRKYDAIAPNNPHALHMPTHIYTRLGEWERVISGNLRAADAALLHPAGAAGELVWDEFPHAIEYLVYAYLQQAEDEAAATQLKRLHDIQRLEPTFKTAFHLASTQARYALERRAWQEALAIEPRAPAVLDWDRMTWPEAIQQFARGLGAVHLGKDAQVSRSIERLGELEQKTRDSGEDLFARNISVLKLELSAWRAHRLGDPTNSVRLMREAVALETATPKHAVTPAPTLPAYEQLGDLYMDQEQPSEALAAYRKSLELYPNRFNSLLGAARAARANADDTAARGFYERVLDVAGSGTREAPLTEARTHLKR